MVQAPSSDFLRAHSKFPLVLLALLAILCAATLWAPPAGRVSWMLEVTPGLFGVLALGLSFRRLPLTHLAYLGVFFHVLILIYGGYYTYALTPLGNWAKLAFDWQRNHYDRVGHLALGFFPYFVIREVLLGVTPLRRGGWFTFLIFSVVLAIAAFWEILEWWVTVLVASDVGQAFLGSQGDVWDAQWDMLLAVVGAGLAQVSLGRVHDRALLFLQEAQASLRS
ncbi:MAG: DUF2238 domain-containing protein [Polyangiaceae bacterium]|nr:DUF2238 domain-containing protein [Polyangiaceae bacterium]